MLRISAQQATERHSPVFCLLYLSPSAVWGAERPPSLCRCCLLCSTGLLSAGVCCSRFANTNRRCAETSNSTRVHTHVPGLMQFDPLLQALPCPLFLLFFLPASAAGSGALLLLFSSLLADLGSRPGLAPSPHGPPTRGFSQV